MDNKSNGPTADSAMGQNSIEHTHSTPHQASDFSVPGSFPQLGSQRPHTSHHDHNGKSGKDGHPSGNMTVIQPTTDERDYHDTLPHPGSGRGNATADPFDWVPGRDSKVRSTRSGETELADQIQQQQPWKRPVEDAHESRPMRKSDVPNMERTIFRRLRLEHSGKKVSLEGISKGQSEEKTRKEMTEALKEKILETIEFGFVDHEDHHPLEPGMMILDEVYLAMLTWLRHEVKELHSGQTSKDDFLQEVQTFVNHVNGVGLVTLEHPACREGLKYRPFIASRLDYPEVDSTRVIVVWDTNQPDRVTGLQLIVGAWKGGTHSTGSPH